MKKEIKTSQRIVTDTITVYIADDGKEFDNKIACENYEKDLKENELEMQISPFKIEKLDGVLPITNAGDWRDVDASWYEDWMRTIGIHPESNYVMEIINKERERR